MISGHPRRRALTAKLIILFGALTSACGGGTEVTQELGGPEVVRCQVTLAAEPRSVPADGGAATVSVDAARDCTWTASANAAWATVTPGSGQGAATLSVTIASSQQPSVRTAVVTVNNQSIDIAQEARPCRFSLGASSGEIGSAGGSLNVTVAAADGCTWRASSPASWIDVPADGRSGPGVVELAVGPNPGPQRAAVVTIADQPFTVVQFAAGAPPPVPPTCTPMVEPAALDVPATAATQMVRLEVAAGCAWTAASGAPWLTIASEASGQGAATVRIAIAQNTGAARTGTVTIASQAVTVRQAAPAPAPPPCTYDIDPALRSFQSSGGEGRVDVATADGCEWSASSNASWVTVLTARGTGSGAARYRVLANSSTSSRSATLTIAGRPHRVTQSGAAPPCTFSLEPGAASIGASGGGGVFNVVTGAGCAWTAVASAPWVTLTAGSGTGPGEVAYTVQANASTDSRSTTIVVANRSHTVTQAGAAPACTYSVSPPSAALPAAGGPGSFTVTTQQGCAWSVSGGAGWISLSALTGSGTGEVTYTVQPNTAAEARSATVMVAGQPHSITQAGAAPVCTFAVNPSQTIGAAGGEGRVAVTTQAGCGWTASGGAEWLSISNGTGTGSGEVSFIAMANPGTETRTATIVVGGQTHVVTQTGAAPVCTYSLSPASTQLAAAGGEGRFGVSTQAGCAWSAGGGAPWISITAGAGNGSGEVVFTAQANATSDTRAASIVVGGQSHAVTQAAAAPVCTYSLSPQSYAAPAAGGEGRFTVLTQAGCAWNTSGGAGWITIGTASGAGQGEVVYTVQANTGTEARSAAIAVGGQSHSVTQPAPAPAPAPAPEPTPQPQPPAPTP